MVTLMSRVIGSTETSRSEGGQTEDGARVARTLHQDPHVAAASWLKPPQDSAAWMWAWPLWLVH